MRIDRTRLQNVVFPFTYQMQTRFSDLDKVGHVNNVSVAAIFQEGRNRFIHAFQLLQAAPCNFVVAAAYIEFADDLFHPDPVDISVGLIEVGRSSARVGQVACQNGRICAYAEAVQVARDEKGSTAWPEAWRPIFERMMIRNPS
jgi:acyl-CoA thioester hydrolase